MAAVKSPTRESRWRWAVLLRLRPLRMTDLSAGECPVRLTGRAETPHSRLLRSLTSSSSFLQGTVQASLPFALASFVRSRSALRFAALWGIGAVSLGHTRSEIRAEPSSLELCLMSKCRAQPPSSLCRHSALPCLRFTAHRHRQSTTSSLKASSRHNVVAWNTAVLTSISATDTACRMRSRTSSSSPHNAKIALHIALFESDFRLAPQGSWGLLREKQRSILTNKKRKSLKFNDFRLN